MLSKSRTLMTEYSDESLTTKAPNNYVSSSKGRAQWGHPEENVGNCLKKSEISYEQETKKK